MPDDVPAVPKPLKFTCSQWVRDADGLVYWRCTCNKCGWTSRDLPFPDPDAALHCGHLHYGLSHEEEQ